jgi:hypothetical protein
MSTNLEVRKFEKKGGGNNCWKSLPHLLGVYNKYVLVFLYGGLTHKHKHKTAQVVST